MTRRLLALLTTLTLFLGALPASSQAILVCRMSGVAMAPVTDSSAGDPCCKVKLKATGGSPHFELTDPGCCDLVQYSPHAIPPALKATSTHVSPPATLTVGPGCIIPQFAIIPPAPVADDVGPRGPPRLTPPGRAPPVFF